MGLTISREPRSDQELAYQLRKQNCKITQRIYKIIEESYKRNYLNEFEFHATIGWYHGLKFRHQETEDEAFITALDKINDLLCTTIQERYAEQIKDKVGEHQPLMPPGLTSIRELSDNQARRFKRILENSPYDKNTR